MSLQVENMEKNMAKLTIEVSAEELEKAIQGAYLKQRNKISVPGFRKGKVPRQMIEGTADSRHSRTLVQSQGSRNIQHFIYGSLGSLRHASARVGRKRLQIAA